MNVLPIAAHEGHFEICQEILNFNSEQDPDENPTDMDGWTPLHSAAKQGNFEICQLLLEYVWDKIPVSINEVMTPVYYAEENGHIEIVELFNEIRDNVSKRNLCYQGWASIKPKSKLKSNSTSIQNLPHYKSGNQYLVTVMATPVATRPCLRIEPSGRK